MKPIKPRRMWASKFDGEISGVCNKLEDAISIMPFFMNGRKDAIPVLVIPTDPASLAALQERVAKEMMKEYERVGTKDMCTYARAALRAIGVKGKP